MALKEAARAAAAKEAAENPDKIDGGNKGNSHELRSYDAFRAAGLQWPPVWTDDLELAGATAHLTDRMRQIVWLKTHEWKKAAAGANAAMSEMIIDIHMSLDFGRKVWLEPWVPPCILRGRVP